MKKKIFGMILVLLIIVGCNSNQSTSSNGLISELLTNDQIIVGISPDYPPFEDLNTQGEIEGFDVDLMNELIVFINENENLQLKVTWKSLDFDNIIGALQSEQIDIGLSGFTYDPSRDVFFSVPYIVSQQVVVVNTDSGIKSINDLSGKKIGVQTGTTGESAAQEISEAKLVSLSDAMQLFAQLQTQTVDAVVIDKAVGENYIKSNNATILTEPLIDENMSIIIGKKNSNLQKVIDAAISEFVKTPNYQQLLEKWSIEQ